jgi:Tsp45I type II restriction enzyme
MNYWTELSIQFANQRNYLDELFSVYPLAPDVIRHLDETTWKKVEAAFQTRNDQELLQNLLTLDLFPIKDSYVPYLRRDRTALPRNPETVKRICGRLYEMGLEKIWARSSEPKETNRQIGPLFRRWLNQNTLGLPLLSELEFTATKDNAILSGSDAQLKQFAKNRLGYTGRKGLDFVARMHRKYVIGEAKFLTDFGGHQNGQFADGLSLLADTSASAIKVAIYDVVLYIRSKSGFFTYLTTHKEQYNILSSLLLRDFLYAIGS